MQSTWTTALPPAPVSSPAEQDTAAPSQRTCPTAGRRSVGRRRLVWGYQSIQQASRLHLLTIKLGAASGGRKSPAGHTELSSPVHRTTAAKGPHLRGRAWRAQQQDGVPSHRHIRPAGQRCQCFTCSPPSISPFGSGLVPPGRPTRPALPARPSRA